MYLLFKNQPLNGAHEITIAVLGTQMRLQVACLACLGAVCAGQESGGTLALPSAPPVAPQSVPSSVRATSMELKWPRGDDATVEHPTEWFEIQQKVLGSSGPGDGWVTAEGGDRVGAPAGSRREGQHAAQIISVRVDRGEKVSPG